MGSDLPEVTEEMLDAIADDDYWLSAKALALEVRRLRERVKEGDEALELLESVAQVAEDTYDCPCCGMYANERGGSDHDADCPIPKYRRDR